MQEPVKMGSLSHILSNHLTRMPVMQVQDAYKLLHQAAMGSEHAVHDKQAARDRLADELAGMGDGPDDPLLDPLSPDGQILRVHLRPFIASGKHPEDLLQAFIRTTNEWRGSVEKLREFEKVLEALAGQPHLPFSALEVRSFFASMEAQGFPAVHHSQVYLRLYRPAYRVVARQFLEEI